VQGRMMMSGIRTDSPAGAYRRVSAKPGVHSRARSLIVQHSCSRGPQRLVIAFIPSGASLPPKDLPGVEIRGTYDTIHPSCPQPHAHVSPDGSRSERHPAPARWRDANQTWRAARLEAYPKRLASSPVCQGRPDVHRHHRDGPQTRTRGVLSDAHYL
jgi:hypothetical protein